MFEDIEKKLKNLIKKEAEHTKEFKKIGFAKEKELEVITAAHKSKVKKIKDSYKTREVKIEKDLAESEIMKEALIGKATIAKQKKEITSEQLDSIISIISESHPSQNPTIQEN